MNIPNIARIPLHDPLVRRRRSGVLQGRPDIKQSDPHPPRLQQPSDLLSKPLTAARDDDELFVPEHGPRGAEREILVQKREEFEGEVSEKKEGIGFQDRGERRVVVVIGVAVVVVGGA